MIIWGGLDGVYPDYITNSGGRYDPATDTWTPTSIAGAPTAREAHTAVWAGSEMIVWGGYGWTTHPYARSGGRYGVVVDADGDGFAPCDGDCSDANALIHPGALEVCDGLDNDCDGVVDDGLGPVTVTVGLEPDRLSPPNHRIVDIHATITLSGGCPSACPTPPAVLLTSVTSNEPDDANGAGDGQTVNDIQDATMGSTDLDFKLRAERDGAGDGRTYQVTYTVTDCVGDTAVGHGAVLVPHDEGGQSDPVVMEVRDHWDDALLGYSLDWNPITGATAYNVVRGQMSSLQAVGSYTVIAGAQCVAREVTSPFAAGALIDEDPPPGGVFFFLTEYVGGSYSGYGSESGGREIVITSGDSCH
jgi:hypothetical protein